MPATAARNLYVLNPKKQFDEKEQEAIQEMVNSDENTKEDNVLLEKAYLNSFWQMLRLKLAAQSIMLATFGYAGFSMYLGVFNVSVLRVLAGTGLVTQSFVIYIGKFRMDDLQNQIEPLYKRQIDAYERFFQDDYDDYN